MYTKNTAHMQHGINAANKTITADNQSPSHSSVVMMPFARNNKSVTNSHENELESSDQTERHVTYQLCRCAKSSTRVAVLGD